MRTNLFYALVDDPPKVITVTSPNPGEGKSIVCANLGVVVAQAGKKTLVVDCDLRRPTLHKRFEVHNLHGLVNVLVGDQTLQDVWQEPVPGLKMVTIGPLPINPTELLGSKRFADFLRQMRQDFDYVLLDAPPTELVADPAIIATQGDGVLLVFDAQNTRKVAVRRSIRSLQTVGANLLGTVMNNVKGTKGFYYRGGYTYE